MKLIKGKRKRKKKDQKKKKKGQKVVEREEILPTISSPFHLAHKDEKVDSRKKLVQLFSGHSTTTTAAAAAGGEAPLR